MEVPAPCHCCHREWGVLKDFTPSEPFRRGAPVPVVNQIHNLSYIQQSFQCIFNLSLRFQVQKDDPGSKTLAGKHKTLIFKKFKQEAKS